MQLLSILINRVHMYAAMYHWSGLSMACEKAMFKDAGVSVTGFFS